MNMVIMQVYTEYEYQIYLQNQVGPNMNIEYIIENKSDSQKAWYALCTNLTLFKPNKFVGIIQMTKYI